MENIKQNSSMDPRLERLLELEQERVIGVENNEDTYKINIKIKSLKSEIEQELEEHKKCKADKIMVSVDKDGNQTIVNVSQAKKDREIVERLEELFFSDTKGGLIQYLEKLFWYKVNTKVTENETNQLHEFLESIRELQSILQEEKE